MKNKNFISGLTKLENNILNSLNSNQKDNGIIPIIEIPEEFDPTFGITFSSNLEKAYNCPNIFDILITRIKIEGNINQKDSVINAIMRDALASKYLPQDVIELVNDTNHISDIILAAELEKEISDAYYYIMYRIAKTTIEEIGALDSETGYIFNELIDPTFSDALALYLLRSKLYRPVPDNYTMYNYVYNVRQQIMAIVSAYTYNRMRNYCYNKQIVEDSELFNFVYNENLFTYLYIFDNMLSIILNSFQYKIAYCYSDTMRFDELVEEDNENE